MTEQISGRLNRPVNIGSYYLSAIEGSAQRKIYGDIVFATEQWSSGSGQTHYRVRPQLVENSFSFQNIWDPWEEPGPVLTKTVSGPTGGHTDDLEYEWKGTRFTFQVTHACRVSLKIYDYYNTQLIASISGNSLMLTGEKSFHWNGLGPDGEPYCGPGPLKLRINVVSVYDQNLVYDYVFPFYPCTGMPASKQGLTKVETGEPTPAAFEVSSNYPNPFNSTTHIRYQLPEKGKVKIVIYNVLGQEVKRLVDHTQEAGSYTVQWNGRNDFGAEVGSGVYFFRISFNNAMNTTHSVKKLLLLK